MDATAKAPRRLQPAQVRRARRQHARGLPVPGDVRAARRRELRDAPQPPARRLPLELRQGRHDRRAAPQPRRLRRPHHRLDGRARGARREGAPDHRVGHPEPPARAAAARHRRDDPLRDEQLVQAADAERADSGTRRTTRACTAGCRRRRSATPGSRRSRPRRTRPTATTSSTSSSPARAASTRSRAATRSSRRTSPPTTPRARRTAASPRRSAETPRRLRLAGRPQPLAGHAPRGPGRRGSEGLELPAAAGPAGALRGDRPGARRRRLPRART